MSVTHPGEVPIEDNDNQLFEKMDENPCSQKFLFADEQNDVVVNTDTPSNPIRSTRIPSENQVPYSITPDYIFEFLERKNITKIDAVGGMSSLYENLVTHPENGISSSTVKRRQEVYGVNVLLKKDSVTFLEFFIEAFKDPIIIILAICAVISIILGMTLANPHTGEIERDEGWIEGTAIIISILVVTLTASINNYQKAKRFEEMECEQSVSEVQVFRDGSEVTIQSDELVVGDIIIIEGGTILCCDGVYVYGRDLVCNESAMTGEAESIKKSHDRDPFFISGTQVMEGSGRMMVVAVGMNSIQGRLKVSTDEETQVTPLQEHLGILADDIAKIGFAVAFLLLAALYIKEGIMITRYGKEVNAAAFLKYLIIAVTLIVVAIPEGLPLAVTISLAFSMKSMMADQCLVRVLASCETMGAATAVCSDKTGTLTMNQMTVVQGVVCNEEFHISGYGLELPKDRDNVSIIDRRRPTFSISPELTELFCDSIALNSTAREQNIDGKLTWIGDKTEHGLLEFCNLNKHDYKSIRARVSESDQRQYPFTSDKKRMTTIVRRDGKSTIYMKGASEMVLNYCDNYMNSDGMVKGMCQADMNQFKDQIAEMADQGNRTIGIAYSDYDLKNFPDEEPVLDSYTFLGVLGIQDPIRTEVPEAVNNCNTAGITVRVVTGDNINTAIAIAKKCNIYSDNGWDYAMLGEDFRDMYNNSRDELLDLIPRLRVLARSSPHDKYILVSLLQELGEVVGVTGDGTNDAPALKLSNVGFAMQIGTDIAKGASDMVLLDNNFASVINAVKWGRAVNDNIRKFLQYQLSINVAGIILTFVGALASPTSKQPFSAVQLLWLNLIMDTLAAVALSTEKPCNASLLRHPIYKQSNLISRRMKGFISIHGLYQTCIILIILFTGHKWLETVEGDCGHPFPETVVNAGTGERIVSPVVVECHRVCNMQGGKLDGHYCFQGNIHSTVIFNTFIWFQIVNIFNARKLFDELNLFEGLMRSKFLLFTIVIIIAFQIFAVEVAGKFLDTAGLSWKQWIICVGFGLSEVVIGVIVKVLPLSGPIPGEVQAKLDKVNTMKQTRGVIKRRSSIVEGAHILRRDPSLRRNTMVRRQH